ncbi:uncharacterized protein I303_102451 [Kwoniella dejecticola CBS 10117]|uniref:BTB domain-containing protein n=1 Tax=Kwoniella dejecticola CBS 10117 TaxID=1296121 RepID=A0A1A6A8S3_9TREE|nr:uncharacterized protein I303_02466 [Kwoniella dejecticola CBS 10117]OBR86459.1 hypothetical protein I303_02466 [Kwoniella dejecticola CBS 10117]
MPIQLGKNLAFTSVGPASIDSWESDTATSPPISPPILVDAQTRSSGMPVERLAPWVMRARRSQASAPEPTQASTPSAVEDAESIDRSNKTSPAVSECLQASNPPASIAKITEGPEDVTITFEDFRVSASKINEASTTSKQTKEGELQLDKKYYDFTGDLRLISTDGIVFRTSSNHLRFSSKAFASMYPLSSSPKTITIQFEEEASVLRFFLNFLHGDIPKPKFAFLGDFRRAIGIAKIFDCKLVLTAMKYLARQYMYQDDYYSRYIFIIGSNLGDINLCADAIRDGDDYAYDSSNNVWEEPMGWYDEDANKDQDFNEEKDVFDDFPLMLPVTWSVADIKQIPVKYYAALLRATRTFTKDNNDWYEAANEFEELMSPPSTQQKAESGKVVEKVTGVKETKRASNVVKDEKNSEVGKKDDNDMTKVNGSKETKNIGVSDNEAKDIQSDGARGSEVKKANKETDGKVIRPLVFKGKQIKNLPVRVQPEQRSPGGSEQKEVPPSPSSDPRVDRWVAEMRLSGEKAKGGREGSKRGK